MADAEVSGKVVKEKPSVAEIAKQQALKGFGAAAGGVNTPLNPPGGTASANCGTGSPTGEAPAGENPALGESSGAGGPLSGPLSGINPSVQNMIKSSVPAGCRAQVTPRGGNASRPERPGSAHPRGLAADTNLFCGGKQQFKGSPQMNQYLYNLNNNGARGLSYYDSGFVHADLMGTNQRRWGNNQSYLNSATKGENPGPGAAQAAGQGGAGGGDPCAGGYSGGCQPVQSSAIQNASALAQNKGFDIPSSISDLTGSLLSNSPLAAAAQQAMGAAQNLLGAAGGLPLSPAALADPTSAITKLVGDKVAQMGAGLIPSMVGNLPASLAAGAGLGKNQITDLISNTANQVFSKVGGIPQLDKFISVFNMANGAQGFTGALQTTIGNTMNNVFGNASSLFQGNLSKNNWSNTPGFTPSTNPYTSIADASYLGEVVDAINNTVSRSDFIGPPQQVLSKLVNTDDYINAFSSMFPDWNAYTTRGYGTVTNWVSGLGYDFKGLGKMADLNDILRIGTPGQIAQQIIINGAGGTSGLLSFMAEKNLKFSDLSSFNSDSVVAEYLNSVNDPDTIDFVKQSLEMNDELNIETLGDLLDTKKILPTSYDYNYFENINDIAVYLAMCSGSNQIRYISDLGALLETFEELDFDDGLKGEPAVYNYNDISQFAENYAPVGFFSYDGSLSIADFIGSAAGYIHDTTLPKIEELQVDLYENTNYFDDYLTLLNLLTSALNGTFTVLPVPPAIEKTIDVPTTAGYTFGIYLTMDDAVSDIVDSIEAELQLILDTIDNNNDQATKFKLLELDSLHNESSKQLVREQKLRSNFGFNLGDDRAIDTFISDGSTLVLPLSNKPENAGQVAVYISGVWQAPTSYTVSIANSTVTLSSSPNAGSNISISYTTDAFTGMANKMQVWEFAASLENYALDTGFGRSADFLRRIATNDTDGQRILATLKNARNREKSRNAGLNCPDFETVNGAAPTYINYINWSGIWTSDPDRAAEIWVQNNQDVNFKETYLIEKIQQNKSKIQEDLNLINQNIVRQLVFFLNGDLVISDLMVQIYQENLNGEVYNNNTSNLFIPYSEEIPSDGYILGPYKEILSVISNKENLRNDVFNQAMSVSTENYLKDIGMDLNLLTTIVQKILMVTGARYLGVDEVDLRGIFGVQSVAKSIMQNIVNNL